MLLKGYIIIILLMVLIISSFSTCSAEPEHDLIIESELKYLFGQGGGEITITVQGELAQDIREDIYQDLKINPSSLINDDVEKTFVEAIEDLLELNIAHDRLLNSIDQPPEDAEVDYDGHYKIIDLGGTGRADIKSVSGLVGTGRNDSSKFTIKMDIKGELLPDNEIKLSDGYIILYALFGENITSIPVKVKETCRIMNIGMNSYSDYDLASGGKITHYRLVMGDYIEYKHSYELSGYEMSDDTLDTVTLDGFNIIQNALVLAIFIIIFTVIPGVVAKHFIRINNLNKVTILRILALIFFIILAIIYFMGIDGATVWLTTIIFFVINIILVVGVYQKGWGSMAKVTVRREDFMKEPPTIAEGPWHERGISNAKVGNFKEAVNCFENALESEPENAIIWNDLGFALRKLGKYRQAIDCFNKSITLRPGYSTAMENLEKAKTEMASQRKKKRRV